MRFTAARREYECGFSPRSTIRENLDILLKLIGEELKETCLFTGDEIVSDETASFIYDQNVSIGSLGIHDGCVLTVY